MRIQDIDWSQRERLGHGKEAVVYLVAPGYVAKVGGVGEHHAEGQQLLAAVQPKPISIPVIDFQRYAPISEEVAEEVCLYHGVRAEPIPDSLAELSDQELRKFCGCRGCCANVMLMPQAEPISAEERKSKEVLNFLSRAKYWAKKLGVCLDNYGHGNVMRYNGSLIVIDVTANQLGRFFTR